MNVCLSIPYGGVNDEQDVEDISRKIPCDFINLYIERRQTMLLHSV